MAGLVPAISLRKANPPKRGHRDKPGDDKKTVVMQKSDKPEFRCEAIEIAHFTLG